MSSSRQADWQPAPLAVFARALAKRASSGGQHVAVIAVDGHSASGKSTLAGRLSSLLPHSAVLHTDDLAWHHSVFAWGQLLIDGVLTPLRAGDPVNYRPPPWAERGRGGAIVVAAGIETLIIEGVGASRRDLASELDATVWVETPEAVRVGRDAIRIAAGEVSLEVQESWMSIENPFIADDRPWDRADFVVAGWPVAPYDPAHEVVVLGLPLLSQTQGNP